MKIRQPGTTRRAKSEKTSTKVGPRIFVFFVIVAIVTGAIAISLNAKIEKQERTHSISKDNR
jgi:hypothetical protein